MYLSCFKIKNCNFFLKNYLSTIFKNILLFYVCLAEITISWKSVTYSWNKLSKKIEMQWLSCEQTVSQMNHEVWFFVSKRASNPSKNRIMHMRSVMPSRFILGSLWFMNWRISYLYFFNFERERKKIKQLF